jgi:hypothetical protein
MIPTVTKFIIPRLTCLESQFFGYRSAPSCMAKWQDRTDVSLETYDAILDGTVGKIAEWGSDEFLISIGQQSSKPDHGIYTVDKKNYSDDHKAIMSKAEFATKTKLINEVKTYGINATFTKGDPEITVPTINKNLYMIQTVTDVNLSYEFVKNAGSQTAGKYYPIMNLTNVSVEVFCCVKVTWLEEHKLFYTADRKQPDKLTVVFDHGPYKHNRPGVRSILEVIESEYGGDKSFLWQL